MKTFGSGMVFLEKGKLPKFSDYLGFSTRRSLRSSCQRHNVTIHVAAAQHLKLLGQDSGRSQQKPLQSCAWDLSVSLRQGSAWLKQSIEFQTGALHSSDFEYPAVDAERIYNVHTAGPAPYTTANELRGALGDRVKSCMWCMRCMAETPLPS